MKNIWNWFSHKGHNTKSSTGVTGEETGRSSPAPVMHSWICNKCFKTINGGELRYKSLEFQSYDLCEQCYDHYSSVVASKASRSDDVSTKRDSEQLMNGDDQMAIIDVDGRGNQITIDNAYFIPCNTHKHELKTKKVNDSRANKTLHNAFIHYAKHKCFGVYDETVNMYRYFTYGQIHERVLNFASGLVQLGLVPAQQYGSGDNDSTIVLRSQNTKTNVESMSVSDRMKRDRIFVVISGRNCLEWFIADYACMHKSLVSLPIHFTLTESDMTHIVDNAGASIVICTADLTQKYLSIAKHANSPITTIIEMGQSQEDRVLFVDTDDVDRKVCVMSFEHVERNANNQMKQLVELSDPNDVITIIYTSGSTGTPKGAMITDSAYNHNLHGMVRGDPEHIFSFCPLAHMSDRKHVAVNICNGSSVAIFQKDMNDIFTHIQLVRPTTLVSTPRLWNILYGEYQRQLLIDKEKYPEKEPSEVEKSLLIQFKSMLGDRLETIVTGGAPTAPSVLRFLKECYQCVVSNGYGATEVGGILQAGYLKNDVQYKLVDVPEMKYYSTDKPYPRGELCVKTKEMFAGYFNNEELTNTVIDQDGFHHTGDIVAQKGERCFELIDRLKNIFKLAQGEFVAPEYVEIQYLKSPYVDQIYIYGESSRSYVLAVVVPNKLALKDWAMANTILQVSEPSDEELIQLYSDEAVRDLFEKEFIRIAGETGLQNYEIPRGFILEHEPFTNENGKLTALLKIARVQCELCYRERLNALYSELQDKEHKQLQSELVDLLESILEDSNKDRLTDDGASLKAMGVDSLHAVKFANLIKKKYNVDIPVKELVGSATMLDVTSLISSKGSGKVNQDVIDWSEQIVLEDDVRVQGEDAINDFSLKTKSQVLITGVTGFLGIFLLHELLSTTDCTVHCLVRVDKQHESNSQQVASERIESLMTQYQIWEEGYRERIIPVVGDLAQQNLGLSIETFTALSEKIEVIYHNGARVNSILSYQELKDVNVQSTRSILKLATLNRLKIVHYVSTISVVQGMATNQTISEQSSYSNYETEEALARRLSRISGYSSSKWVSEQLCHEARKRGVPITIYRPGMIGPHRTLGVCNLSDWVIRFIRGCLELQHYPITGANRIIDLTPVDVVSKAIVALSQVDETQQDSTPVYHILNTQGSISFDQIFEIIAQTKPLTACHQFSEWLQHLNRRLENESMDNQKLWPLKVLFKNGFPSPGGTFSSDNTLKVLAATHTHLLPCPIDAQYVNRFLEWLNDCDV